jgi:hypothetical protein
MATFDVSGLGELMLSLSEIAEIPDDVQDEMLNAQADVVIPAQQAKARAYGLVDTGQMVRSIGKTKPKRAKGGGRVIYVYPQGSRTRGRGKKTSNATIAFANEYGVRGRAPRPFVRDANAACEEQMFQAAWAVYDKWLQSKNL